jgi:hypothetical protein
MPRKSELERLIEEQKAEQIEDEKLPLADDLTDEEPEKIEESDRRRGGRIMSVSYCCFRAGFYKCLNPAVQQVRVGDLFVDVCKLHADGKRYEIVLSGEDKVIFRRLTDPIQSEITQDRRKSQLELVTEPLEEKV